jgi:hypothetical protein
LNTQRSHAEYEVYSVASAGPINFSGIERGNQGYIASLYFIPRKVLLYLLIYRQFPDLANT